MISMDRYAFWLDGLLCIPLAGGKHFLVDVGDVDLQYKHWSLSQGYAQAWSSGRPAHILAHRVILERALGRSLGRSEVPDHINGDRLDNRRSNLRVATYAQNTANASKQSRSKSPYKGVSRRTENSWAAVIYVDKRKVHIGSYSDALTAAYMHDQFALALRGEYARTNVL